MQTVSTAFTTRTNGSIRRLQWSLLASFDKTYDADIDFFTIGTSEIGGTDILKGSSDVVQEWDKFDYEDLSDRLLSIEYTRENEPPIGAVTMAFADIVLDNHDDLFTPTNASSRLYGKLGVGRPMRLYLGFNTVESIQVFIGFTDSLPDIDERGKTAKFHCIDFFKKIESVELNEEVIYIDKRSDEVISGILQTAGLLTTQFVLDTGSTVIPFAYFKKGSKVGEAIREIIEAELGAIYMDENGIIRMENRTNWTANSEVWQLGKDNVLELSTYDPGKVINRVEVFSQARTVQAKQKIWELSGSTEIPASGSLEIWADFKDDYGELPVTAVDDPNYISSATTSLYATNVNQDGTGATKSANVALDSSSLFSTAMKLVFTNSATVPVYLTQLELWGTPAKVTNDIYIIEEDASSIASYETTTHKIENNYIQDEPAAISIAKIILADRAEVNDQVKMLIKGIPQLQIGDVVRYTDSKSDETYYVTQINGILNSSGFRQTIIASKRTINEYFRVGVSTIGSGYGLAP